jgi:hypothetical protein
LARPKRLEIAAVNRVFGYKKFWRNLKSGRRSEISEAAGAGERANWSGLRKWKKQASKGV